MGNKKTKLLQMKFATIALVASASAIQIEGKACVGWKESKAIFNAIDTNDNGQVGEKELVRALKAFAKSRDYKPTKADWEWVGKTASKDAGTDHTLSPKEFHKCSTNSPDTSTLTDAETEHCV